MSGVGRRAFLGMLAGVVASRFLPKNKDPLDMKRQEFNDWFMSGGEWIHLPEQLPIEFSEEGWYCDVRVLMLSTNLYTPSAQQTDMDVVAYWEREGE